MLKLLVMQQFEFCYFIDKNMSGIKFHNFNLCEYQILQVLNFTMFPKIAKLNENAVLTLNS